MIVVIGLNSGYWIGLLLKNRIMVIGEDRVYRIG